MAASRVFTPSPQQTSIFAYVLAPEGGNAIVEAVAGAGKTTTLIEACKRMKGRIAAIAYNSKMAKELRERTNGLGLDIWAKTFHAFGMNALNFRFKNSGVSLRDPDDKKVVKLLDAWIAENGRKDLVEVAPTVAKVVSMAKQRGIGICFPDTDNEWYDMIEHFDLANDLPETHEHRVGDIVIPMAKMILRKSNEQARDFGIIDFDDMIFLPLLWNMRLTKFQWVLVDEAQDTNPTRREMAKRMVAPDGRMLAVGDPAQAIYGFSGADNDALDQIRNDFNATTLPLTVTYRCPKAVVDVARQFVDHITAHESAPDGLYTEQPYEALHNQLEPGDAVLCRYTRPLVTICFKLIRQGKSAHIEGRAIGAGLVALTNKWKTQNLDRLSSQIRAWEEREANKATVAGKDRKADEIHDRAETLYVLIERAFEQKITSADDLRIMIASLFDDDVANKKGMITLCSVHRSKGFEWPRVFILGLFELMGKECNQPWQTTQEQNLQYVAVTRAQEFLVNVVGVKEEQKK